jgi:hypothetical protein
MNGRRRGPSCRRGKRRRYINPPPFTRNVPLPLPHPLPPSGTGRSFIDVITLDKKRAAGAVLLELLAERPRLREALDVLRQQHGVSLESDWEKLATADDEDTALYDAWIEHRGLSAALQAVESEIAGIRHGDFSFA